MSLAFLSYRRSDLGHFALWLADRLAFEFGARSVFIDRTDLPIARSWNHSLLQAVHSANVFLLLVGPGWLKAADEHQRRRIDNPEDVVRLEIVNALSLGKPIIPVVLGRENWPSAAALPEELLGAFASQGIILDNDMLFAGVDSLIERLVYFGLERQRAALVYPERRKKAKPLSASELEGSLASLPGWRVHSETSKGGRLEESLHRVFIFDGFQSAMGFMHLCTDMIAKRDHHPRWMNLWSNVEVWLTTFDIDNRITTFDVELAREMQAIAASGAFGPGTPQSGQDS